MSSADPSPDRTPEEAITVDIHELMELALEALSKRGPLDDPSELRAFLPGGVDAGHYVLIELIKLDMAMAAEKKQIRRIEYYYEPLADLLAAKSIPIDLVMEEIQLRKELGEIPSRDEYAKRFPQFDTVLERLVGGEENTAAVKQSGPVPEQEIGSQLDDFLIVQKLGEGAFAHVYLARQVSMNRLVALKVSRGKGDEPQALAQFDHPNIVRVFDQRELPDLGLHLLYMQYQPGGTLADVIKAVRTTGPDRTGSLFLDVVDQKLLSAAQVVPERSQERDWLAGARWSTVVAWIGVQLARALDDSHSRGVIHRDVKPANVLLSAEAIPKLADFNVSEAGIEGASPAMGGSIGYMAPEHLIAIGATSPNTAPSVQEPADLYSLAVLLWELWQGKRPFAAGRASTSRRDAVKQQLAAREVDLVEPNRTGTASERVLEKVLRSSLRYAPEDRPVSGAELAGRLRLALHPRAARLFDPEEGTRRWRLARVSPWLVTGLAILVPNFFAGIFNYLYNMHAIIQDSLPMEVGLNRVAWWVNWIAYPSAVVLVLWYTRSMARAVQVAENEQEVSERDLTDTLDLGHRTAIVVGAFWTIAGIVYPVVMSLMFPEFTTRQAIHFFISLLICGGVAMVYPFFALSFITTVAFYPRLLRGSMHDPRFDERLERLVRRSEWYLMGSAIIPLLGAALLVSSDGAARIVVLSAIGASVFGLLASFFTHQVVARTWKEMAGVLSTHAEVVPGENEGT